MIRPTLRTIIIFAAGVFGALFVVIQAPIWWATCLAFAGVVLLAMLLDGILAFPSRGVIMKLDAPDKIYIGEQEKLTVTLAKAHHLWPTRFEILVEQRGDVETLQPRTVTCRPDRETQIEFAVMPRRRGRILIERIWARWSGPLGLVELRKKEPLKHTLDIIPNVRGVHTTALQFLTNEAIFGEKVQHKGEGTEFEALREYRPGHDIRFMDWKHSARHRKLLNKEFRTERNHHIVLAFDTGHLMLEPLSGIPRLDHAINAGLRLGWISLRVGDLVGTYGFDARVRHYAEPVRGQRAFVQLQRATAGLDYHLEETNFTLGLAELNARLKRRALVILFTDFVDTITAELLIESIQRMANRHVVVFVTMRDSFLRQTADARPDQFLDVARAVIAQDFLRERSIVLERLTRMGVHCLDVPSSGLSIGLINRYLQIKQRGLI